MKLKFQILILAVIFAMAFAQAFKKNTSAVVETVINDDGTTFDRIENASYYEPGDFAYKTSTGTITNTSNDTLTIPIALASPYQYSWHITLVHGSGTRSLKAYLQESNTTATGTADWCSIDSITPTATINQYARVGSIVGGRRQRVIIDGVTGSQSEAYTNNLTYKKRE